MTHLGIRSLHATLGVMGGMQALLWATLFLSASTRRPDGVFGAAEYADHRFQRGQSIRHRAGSGSWWRRRYDGAAKARAPDIVARMMAHVTYLSDMSLERKFGGKNRRRKGSMTPVRRRVSGGELPAPPRARADFLDGLRLRTPPIFMTKAVDRFDLADAGPLHEVFRVSWRSACHRVLPLLYPRTNEEISAAR